MPRTTDPRYQAVDGKKRCNKCEKILPVDSFYKRKSPDGYRNDCKECLSTRSQVYYEENVESRRAYARSWYHANRERAVERRADWYERVGRERARQQRSALSPEDRAALNERQRQLRASDPERYRRYDIDKRMRSFGLEPRDYDRILEVQNGGCAICGAADGERGGRGLHIDHNHETGEIRGILCHHCNTALGSFRDNVGDLERAISYLKNPPFDQLDR